MKKTLLINVEAKAPHKKQQISFNERKEGKRFLSRKAHMNIFLLLPTKKPQMRH